MDISSLKRSAKEGRSTAAEHFLEHRQEFTRRQTPGFWLDLARPLGHGAFAPRLILRSAQGSSRESP